MSRSSTPPNLSPSEVLAEGTRSEFEAALQASEFPLVVWSTTDGVIVIANRRAADLAQVPLEALIGQTVYDFAPTPQAARAETEALAAGGGGFFGTRPLLDASGREVAAYMWARAVRVDEQVAGVALLFPASDIGRLGPDPSKHLRRLYPVAVGAMGQNWRILAISIDIEELTSQQPDDIVGHSLLEFVHPADVVRITTDRGGPARSPWSQCSIRLTHQQRGWMEICLLTAPFGADRWAFAILGDVAMTEAPEDRVAELELRLRRIGAEVKAAGILDDLITIPTPIDVGKLQELTTRQWEILTLLLQGKRVPTIARELYVSQSTVRNHLSAIFKEFGVHSQPELLEALRS